MNTPELFRRRFIPDELISLKNDTILLYSQDLILTKWNTLHPRNDIARGISAYYPIQGFKISKVLDQDDNLVYWYCDVVQIKSDHKNNTVIIEDLLIDVILYEDGTIRILDIDELADALDKNLITQAETSYALRTLDSLLKIIYQGHFHLLQEPIINAELA